jgi:hypothetical protein
MATNNYSEIFKENVVQVLTISQLIDWYIKEGNSRLLLPPIQRSVVWSNEQVINYWDSLLRGYPLGTMMVHRVSETGSKGLNSDGKTCEATKDDFQLFDGQQRMAAVLLGLGKGQMKDNRKIWVDFGAEPNKSSGLKFQLRMTSSGQPFGYKPDAPNQKIELGKRQIKWEKWRKKPGVNLSPQKVFETAIGSDLIDAKCALSFDEVYDCLRKDGRAISVLTNMNGALAEIVHAFVSALKNALKSIVIIQEVDSKIVSDQEEYIRFFGRLGQGGTRLSDDELTYSIIKHQYPEIPIHERIKEIMQRSGRLAGEVDLVLAALRVAKTLASWDNAIEWEVISRPTPVFVSKLKENGKVESEFKEMIGLETKHSKLATALDSIRSTLAYKKETHPEGLPDMLLARLPRELLEVLILLTVKRHTTERSQVNGHVKLSAFVLYWLLFIGDDGKAAQCAFHHVWKNNTVTENSLIGEYEKEGIARFLPRRGVLPNLREAVKEQGSDLREWTMRFTAADDDKQKPGEALRVLSTNSELIKRALIWLQRDYIVKMFPHYNPMSERDEDLPIDLDHIVPNDIFGFHWSSSSRLQDDAITDNFRWGRGVIGNSLGNFRWLSASDNRSRHEGTFVPLDDYGDFVKEPDDWNRIIPQDKNQQLWSKADITTFQRLIDLRTLDLYEELLTQSGIESILPPTSEESFA